MHTVDHEHASVVLHVSHPEGISAHHERVLADAAAAHVKTLEAHGFQVHHSHVHHHEHHSGSRRA